MDGLLGAPFLREFYVTVDYPNRTLRLYRYVDQSHVLDDYRKVGVEVSASCRAAATISWCDKSTPAPTPRRKGPQARQHPRDRWSLPLHTRRRHVDRKLRGPVGSTRRLHLAGPARSTSWSTSSCLCPDGRALETTPALPRQSWQQQISIGNCDGSAHNVPARPAEFTRPEKKGREAVASPLSKQSCVCALRFAP